MYLISSKAQGWEPGGLGCNCCGYPLQALPCLTPGNKSLFRESLPQWNLIYWCF